MTAISVTLGNIVGIEGIPFHWGRYLLVLVGMILAHAATNVLNDYFDFRHGVDVKGAPTTLYRRHPLVEQDFTPGYILGLSAICYAGATLIGIYFVLTHGWGIALFAILGGLTSIFYTAGPVKYKYRAMGELAVFLMWGPLMMVAAHYIQAQGWQQTWSVLLVSIPQGLWVALVLLANNLKDIEFDRESTVKTSGTLLGRQKTMQAYTLIVIGIYVITLVEILTGILPWWAFLTALSLPAITRLIRRFHQESVVPPDADPQTAKTGTVYGILLVAAIVIDMLFFKT